MIGDEWMVIGEKKPAIRKRGGGLYSEAVR